ncbi:MAG: PAC2 family protein [Candidatus Eremiobacteraeota bacterium]|nr:PAC2 family protein [Candidatus Eremiobacteraeota bacterium]
MKKGPYKILSNTDIQASSVCAFWNEDARSLSMVVKALRKAIGGMPFCKLDPVGFFPLDNVHVRDDVAHIPESVFYAGSGEVVLFESQPPQYEWYRFLTTVLDVAEERCKVQELYTVGRMVSVSAHTTPREIFGIFTSQDIKKKLDVFGVSKDVDYQQDSDQRPTLSSFLIWAAQQRSIPGVNLWVTIPFYLANVGDPRAEKSLLQFFQRRFKLEIDYGEVDIEIREQNRRLQDLRERSPSVNESIQRLETNLILTDEETYQLAGEVEEALSS